MSSKMLLGGVGALALSAALCLSAITFFRVEVLSVHNSISIGMTVEDVTKRLGPPDRISKKGEPLDPPNASGFVPGRENESVVYSYFFMAHIIYVFFSPDNHVSTYYVCKQ